MAAALVDALPEGDDWTYEVKFDGYRALLLKSGARVDLRSRNNKDLTRTYRSVEAAGRLLAHDQAVIDGEIVALNREGRPSFQALQHPNAHPGHVVTFYAFDLLYLDGQDLTNATLEHRRTELKRVVDRSPVQMSIDLEGSAEQVIEAVRSLGLEGIVAKRKGSSYTPGERSSDWVKFKLDRQQEFVIGGYRPGPNGIDALLVGYYEGKSDLRFASKVRAGFTPHLRRELFALIQSLHVTRCPFVNLPNSKTSHWGAGVTAEQMTEMRWVKPRLVAQVRFVEWTSDGHLRHAAFLGVRADKHAKDIRRQD